MKTNIRELRMEHAELTDRAKKMVHRNPKGFDQRDQTLFDKLLSQAAGLKSQIDEVEGDEREEIRKLLGKDRQTRTYGTHIWRDQYGDEVRSFGHGDSIYEEQKDRYGWDSMWDELTLGGLFRAYVVGPQNDAERRALSSTGGQSANIPAPLQARVLDRMREEDFLSRAGAQFVPMDSATLQITRGSTQAVLRWAAEGTTGAVTDPSFTSVTLTAHTHRGVIRASRELISDASDFPQALERELIGGMREVMQRAAISGTTAATQPTGLIYDSAVNSANFGSTAGSAPSSTGAGGWGSIAQARQRLREDNVSDDRLSMVYAPRTARQFDLLRGASEKSWLSGPPALDDVARYATNAMPINLAPTTGLSAQSSIILGDFRDLVVGVRLEPNVQILSERHADSYELGFLASMRVDAAPRNPKSFEVLNRVST